MEKRSGDTLYFSGVDLVDGTPVLDIKPYIPIYDSLPGALNGWVCEAAARELVVDIAPRPLVQLRRLDRKRPGLLRLVKETLRHDPRNPRDRSQLRNGGFHDARFFDRIVRFRVKNGKALVVSAAAAPERPRARRVPVPPELLR